MLGKPSKMFFLLAVEALGCTPGEAVMVGDDAEADVGGALAAGLKGVLVRTGKYRPGDEAALDRIRMCEDCRVIVQFETPNPMAAGTRPITRTTDDDLREREQAKAREMYEKAQGGSSDDRNGGEE